MTLSRIATAVSIILVIWAVAHNWTALAMDIEQQQKIMQKTTKQIKKTNSAVDKLVKYHTIEEAVEAALEEERKRVEETNE